ncbi:DapH/DapD/GlmU-related protein [Flammeovirga sp. SJP92]|uniref:acyltransferase n=1 Tax=Flammeovirga sp. SJP92 TaxID=1775430 RepID=UPI00078715B1|nr:acyltransferase [Flammeovirga sp. SJP92]KXX70522.1 acetyltransferase [Flammeovirga sp. SJP92]
MLSSLKLYVQNNDWLKQFIHQSLVLYYRPRFWVRVLLFPFYIKRGRKAVIRSSARLDLFPFNKVTIGKKTIIEDFVTLNNAVGDLVIGNNVIVGMGNTIIGPVEIKDNVLFAQNIVASALNHVFEDPDVPIVDQGVNTKKITIDENSWIGANVTITQGVHIGKHCVIGAGSVVNKDIPDYHVAIGNPIRLVKRYNFETKNWEKIPKQ